MTTIQKETYNYYKIPKHKHKFVVDTVRYQSY